MKRTILAAALTAAAASPAAAQVHIGVFGSLALFDMTLDTRGSRFVDQGGDGVGFGVRAGYDWRHPTGWVVGAEGQVGFSNLSSRLGATGFDYRLSEVWHTGAYVRVGYSFAPLSLAYVRIGVEPTQLQRSWHNEQDNLVSRAYIAYGRAIGVGAEVPLSPNLFGRIDGTYSRLGGSLERTTVTLSIGWRF